MPVSGAWQLKTRGAIALRPMTSQSGVYSRFVSPAPYSASGRKRFQSPMRLRLRAELLHDRRLVVRIAGRLDLLVVRALVRIDVLVHELEELVLDHAGAVGLLEHRGSPRGERRMIRGHAQRGQPDRGSARRRDERRAACATRAFAAASRRAARSRRRRGATVAGSGIGATSIAPTERPSAPRRPRLNWNVTVDCAGSQPGSAPASPLGW